MDCLRRPFVRVDGDGHAKIFVRFNDGVIEYAQLDITNDGVIDVTVAVISGKLHVKERQCSVIK